ncbi:uncharacterized protein BCR38DRAFT_317673, partial [Pseudomassariella vexata]
RTSPPPTFHWLNVSSSIMERTSSGLSISSDDGTYHESVSASDPPPTGMKTDLEAALEAERRFRTRSRDSKAERILKTLICPRSPGEEFEIDDPALQNIFFAANEMFFCGRLKGRVRWDWSDVSSAQYRHGILGTTALRRRAKNRGYETLIVLSQPLLRSERYNRRLLISTFLHELIHSYLFIRCGPKARLRGGHTEGFHLIANLIDRWAGPDILFLGNMEADLGQF